MNSAPSGECMYMYACMPACMYACWMLLSNQIFKLQSEMGRDDNGCGSGLIGVTCNK